MPRASVRRWRISPGMALLVTPSGRFILFFYLIICRTSSSEESSGASYAEHKEQQKKIRKAEKAVKECETKIEKLETRKAEIDALLMKPENATNMELVTEYTELMKTLDEENENWMMLSEELEEVEEFIIKYNNK